MQIYSNKKFRNPVEIIDGNEHCLKRVQELAQKGLHLLGYVKYDFSKVYFEAYKSFEEYIPSIPQNVGIIKEPMITREEYFKKIQYIKEQILDGITYEVNFTYPSVVKTNANDLELYEFLLQKQKTPYNTFLKNKYGTILSFSPELFFKLEDKKIITKPMKGTTPRGKCKEEDCALKDFLYNDTKNRAENIMIVDLLRNDLGRIAKTGTVKVDKLFEIEEHPTVYQMTSEVSAELRDNIGLYDIFKAIFPCGSITGAPKISTMKVIEETEDFPREVYCGAIGYLHGDYAEFSVPIRILQGKDPHKYIYHAGGAIVWDSTPEDEWEETLTKAKFLETEFSLIETGVNDWISHVDRMKASSKELGFKWNQGIEALEIPENKVLRVILHKNGEFDTEIKDILSPVLNPKIRIKGKVHSANPFLYHKTNIRPPMPQDVYDEIRVNERGEITEGTFTNIGILKDGNYYTPPISSGLLAGTFRAKLNWIEKVLYPEDIKTADKIFCFNSVRGLIEVTLCS